MVVTEAKPQELDRQKQREKNQKSIVLLRSWIEEGDEDEQRESFEALKQGLNAHHSSGRIIYP
jgi:hypothetical protein